MKRALITGITGQDGSYLAELLLEKGYEVHGIIRRSSSFNTARIDAIYQDPHEEGRRLILHYGDLNDASSLNRILRIVDPEEIYNLGAQSHVKVSFDTPEYTGEVTGLGSTRLLKGIGADDVLPHSPYGVAKVYAFWMTGIIARRTDSSRRTGFSSITSRRGAARRSCRARSRGRSEASFTTPGRILEGVPSRGPRAWVPAIDPTIHRPSSVGGPSRLWKRFCAS